MKRHEKMTAPRLLEAVYKRPGKVRGRPSKAWSAGRLS